MVILSHVEKCSAAGPQRECYICREGYGSSCKNTIEEATVYGLHSSSYVQKPGSFSPHLKNIPGGGGSVDICFQWVLFFVTLVVKMELWTAI